MTACLYAVPRYVYVRSGLKCDCLEFVARSAYDGDRGILVNISPFDYQDFLLSYVGRLALAKRFDLRVINVLRDDAEYSLLRCLHACNKVLILLFHFMPIVCISFPYTEYPRCRPERDSPMVYYMCACNLRPVAVVTKNNLGMCRHMEREAVNHFLCYGGTLAWFDPRECTMICNGCRILEIIDYERVMMPLTQLKEDGMRRIY